MSQTNSISIDNKNPEDEFIPIIKTDTDVLEERLKYENDLLSFKLCNQNCITNYSNKNLNTLETTCLRACYGKIKEAERVIGIILKKDNIH